MPINRVVNLSGGQNNQVNQFLVEESEATLIKNGHLEIIGAIQKVLGYDNRGADLGSTPILGLTEYSKNSTGTRYQLLVFNTGVYSWDGDSFESVHTGLTAGRKAEFETFLDCVFMVNGDANRYWDGTTWVTSSTTSGYMAQTPAFNLIKKWREGLYGAGNSSKKSRVWLSDKPQGNKLTWGWESRSDLATTAGSAVVTSAGALFKTYNIKPGDTLRITAGNNLGDYVIRTIDSNTQLTLASNVTNTGTGQSYEAGANWFEVGQDDGDVIKAFGENSDRLLVFKEFSMYRFDGSSAIRIADVGTTSQRSVVNMDRWTLFANRKGIYAYDGVEPRMVSKKLQKYFNAIPEAELPNIVSWSEGDVYRCFIGDVTVDGKEIPNCVINYDVSQNNFWTLSYAHKAVVAAKFTESSQVKVFIGSDSGQVYELNSGNTYDGTAIDFEVITKEYDFEVPEDVKQVNKIVIFGNKLEGVVVAIQADGQTPKQVGTLNGISESLNAKALGRRFRLIFSHALPNQPTIEGFSFDWEKISNG